MQTKSSERQSLTRLISSEGPPFCLVEAEIHEKRQNAEFMPAALIRAARAAGRFQRSGLGYLDYSTWNQRVRSDAQSLMDSLDALGFKPFDRF